MGPTYSVDDCHLKETVRYSVTCSNALDQLNIFINYKQQKSQQLVKNHVTGDTNQQSSRMFLTP